MKLYNLYRSAFLSSSFSQSPDAETSSLGLEMLEDRMMLSTVSIFAAGAAGDEAFQVKVNDQVVATFNDVGGDPSTRTFNQFDFTTDAAITADDIRVQFINDAFDPETGLDRNLFVDKIVVDGDTFETENASVFSTGIFRDGGVTEPGFLQTEELNVNGSFFFSSDGATVTPSDPQTRIRVDAAGSEGGELIAVEVDGRVVDTFELSQSTQTFLVEVDQDVSVTDVEIRFLNDLFQPEIGVDRNATISNVQTINLDTGVREVVRLATNPQVFSTGTFTDADGIVPGFARGDTLNANGVFRFGAADNALSDNPVGDGGGGDAGDGGGVTDGGVRLQLNEEVFDRENPGLVLEDFEGLALPADLPTDFNQNIALPLSSETNNLQIQPGDIVEGVQFQASPLSEFRVNNDNATVSQFPSAVLGTPSSSDFTVDFDPGVRSIGFDLFASDNSANLFFFDTGEVVSSNTNATIQSLVIPA